MCVAARSAVLLGLLLPSCGSLGGTDQPGFARNINVDHAAAEAERRADDARLLAIEDEVFELVKVTVESRAEDELEIPVYAFAPRSGEPKAALVWVCGGLHDRFGINYVPFIRDACAEGYVVLAPEYRGAKGYGEEFYEQFDYGGGDVLDVLAIADHAASTFGFDSGSIGVIGWSDGALIALLAAAEDPQRFGAVVANAPVSNLLIRMTLNGPDYRQLFQRQDGFGGLPEQDSAPYVQRSPFYRLAEVTAPVHAQFAKNDREVRWIEAEMLGIRLGTMRNAEVKVFDSPRYGHFFNRQVDLASLTRRDSPVQVESWTAIWAFFRRELGK